MGSVSVPYNGNTFSGLLQTTWNPNAPIGFVNSGNFVLNREFWTNNPLAGGNFVSLGMDQSATYSAAATLPVGVVPEPTTILPAATGLSTLALRKERSAGS